MQIHLSTILPLQNRSYQPHCSKSICITGIYLKNISNTATRELLFKMAKFNIKNLAGVTFLCPPESLYCLPLHTVQS